MLIRDIILEFNRDVQAHPGSRAPEVRRARSAKSHQYRKIKDKKFKSPAFEANDGQPSEYEEYQDYMGGDDWDHGQFDESEIIESKSADLYHGTSLDNLNSILSDNEFRSGHGNENQISFSRSFNAAMQFALQFAMSDEPAALIVIDQVRLSQQVGKRQKPVDAYNWVPEGTSDTGEQEEAVFAEYIKNADKLIKRIYVFASEPIKLSDPRATFVLFDPSLASSPLEFIESERILLRYISAT